MFYVALFNFALFIVALFNVALGIPEFLDSGRKTWALALDAGLWTLVSGLWTLDSGRWTLNPGCRTLDSGMLDCGR